MILPPLAVPMDEEPSAAGGRRALEKEMNEIVTFADPNVGVTQLIE